MVKTKETNKLFTDDSDRLQHCKSYCKKTTTTQATTDITTDNCLTHTYVHILDTTTIQNLHREFRTDYCLFGLGAVIVFNVIKKLAAGLNAYWQLHVSREKEDKTTFVMLRLCMRETSQKMAVLFRLKKKSLCSTSRCIRSSLNLTSMES